MRINSSLIRAVVLCLFLPLTQPAVHGKIIYVDDDAPPPGDGTSWTTACRYLQDALADVQDSDEPVEIRVAQGIYKPDEGMNQTPGDVEASFYLVSGINLKGGFAGLGHGDPNAQDVRAFETIFSGDLDGDDLPVARATDMVLDDNRLGNAYSVVTIQDTVGTAFVEGVTITGGDRAMGSWLPSGGAGIWCVENSSPTISNCTFTANCVLAVFGGAIFGGAPRIIDCAFYHNYAVLGGAVGYCGGSIRNCRFTGNVAEWGGGALSDYSGSIHDCSFIGNSAAEAGGALDECTGTVTNLRLCRKLDR